MGASLGDRLASGAGRNLAWLAAGVLASAIAAGLLAAVVGQPDDPDRPTMARPVRPVQVGSAGAGWPRSG